MEKLQAGLSSLRPNEDEINWEAANATYLMPSKPCLVTQDEADREPGGCEDTSARITGSDATKTAGIHLPGPQGWTSKI